MNKAWLIILPLVVAGPLLVLSAIRISNSAESRLVPFVEGMAVYNLHIINPTTRFIVTTLFTAGVMCIITAAIIHVAVTENEKEMAKPSREAENVEK